ncbi:HK97 family phage portal protein [Rhodoligotrophos appendicifer]|uniref:phage portal protein n=1 Tax=Rhodoligotrophos appendicifer TaxID=987056 RepID=UPI00195F364A|nr:phage portal protein [Rhodoligotrophos appendicifer]
MGYLTNLRNALLGRAQASSTFDLTSMTPAQVGEFLRIGGSMETASGVSVNDTTAMRVAAAWRCVNIIAGTVGSLPLDLVMRVSENVRKPAVGHPLRTLLTVKPNPWQTPSEFRRMLQAHLMLRGNAYARKVRVGRDTVALIPVVPDRVQPCQLDNLSMEYRVTLRNGSQVRLPQTEMLHLRGMSLDGVTGLSTLSYMKESLGLALQGENSSANLMKNGQFVSGVFKHPEQLSKDVFDRLKASIEEYRNGGARAGGAMILEDKMDYAPVSMSAVDLQFLQMRDFQRYDIAMFFGVPPHMIGATDKATSWGSGIEQQGIGFVTYTLNDWLVTWQESLKRDTIPEAEWEKLDVRFYPQALLKGDSKAQWDAFVKGRQWGVYSANDVRALLDMNPRDDEAGNEYAVPPNQTQATAGDPAEPPVGDPINEPA